MIEKELQERQNTIDVTIVELEQEKTVISNRIKSLQQEKEDLRLQYAIYRLKNRPDISEWVKEEFEWADEVTNILQKIFRFNEFRPNQLAAINATLSKKDVLLIMPTGGGKSLVYQLPTLVTKNLSIVISPLLSLIEDQLMSLRRIGIPAATINSTRSKEEKKVASDDMMKNKLRLLFVTPEWMTKTKIFMNNLVKLNRDGKIDCFIIELQERQNTIDATIVELEQEKTLISNRIKSLQQEKEDLRLQYAVYRLKNRPDISEWVKEEFEWADEVTNMLQKIFRFNEFRPNQLAAINATLSKKDVLLIMPTGGGKSLVYQLPTLVTKNLSIVISPLLSLIEDQLMSLRRIGIPAATINSTRSKEEKKVASDDMMKNKLRLLFVTPEWMAKTKIFMNNLVKLNRDGKIDCFIIDEVHCCSNWGHDFRTDYLSLSLLKGQFPDVPILGLTATATSAVLVDIQKILDIPSAVVITAPYNRPNLFYQVIPKPDHKGTISYLEKLLKGKYKNQSGIIYAVTQKECEDIATALRKHDIKAAMYHANVESDSRSRCHRKWHNNDFQVIVATTAFGMGIDKSDVRYVIHVTVARSLEGMYQESGRAGRDGEDADCVVMFSLGDWLKNYVLCQSKREQQGSMDVLNYCINDVICRRQIISKYFDDDWRPADCNKMCDNCKAEGKLVNKYSVKGYLRDILEIIENSSSNDSNLTLKKLLDLWLQTGTRCGQSAKPKPKITREQGERVIAFLLLEGFLVVKRGYSLVTTIPYIEANRRESFNKMMYTGDIVMESTVIKGAIKVEVQSSPSKSADSSRGEFSYGTFNIDSQAVETSNRSVSPAYTPNSNNIVRSCKSANSSRGEFSHGTFSQNTDRVEGSNGGLPNVYCPFNSNNTVSSSKGANSSRGESSRDTCTETVPVKSSKRSLSNVDCPSDSNNSLKLSVSTVVSPVRHTRVKKARKNRS